MHTAPIDILHVVPAYWPRAGGIETLVAGMAEGLQTQHNITSAVITPRRAGDPQEEVAFEGVTITPVPMPSLDTLENNPRLVHNFFSVIRKTYERLRPKIIHIHAYSEISLPACIIARASGIPCIFHVHGVVEHPIAPSYLKELKTSRHVFAVSQAVADSIKPLTDRTEPVTVIPNGIRHAIPNPERKKTLEGNVPTVAMVGRLEDGKGFEDGLRAIGRVIKAGRTVRTIIVGRGVLGPMLQQLSAELGISHLVEFKGEMSYAETQALIGSAHILLAPSRAIEGFSLACLEAAFLETPVIASAVGGIPETVAHGCSGQLVAPRDIGGFEQALLHYLNNPELAHKHGLQARQRALELFNYEAFIARWMAEYRKIMHPAVAR